MEENVVIQKNKDKFFRGVNVEDMKKMDLREFSKYVKSRPRRLIDRNYDMIMKFVKRCEKCDAKGKPIRTHLREMIIVPVMVGETIYIHNGKEFQKVEITDQMLGHRLGEFSQTRRIAKHTNKTKKK
jgi:small subunit ribosomal protein S19